MPSRTLAPHTHPDHMCAAPEAKTPRKTRAIRLGAATVTLHAALWLAASPTGAILTSLEALVAASIILTALYASPTLSDRAFRMLPWTAGDKSEGPTTYQPSPCANCNLRSEDAAARQWSRTRTYATTVTTRQEPSDQPPPKDDLQEL